MSERLNNKERVILMSSERDSAIFIEKHYISWLFYYIYCRKIVSNSDFSAYKFRFKVKENIVILNSYDVLLK